MKHTIRNHARIAPCVTVVSVALATSGCITATSTVSEKDWAFGVKKSSATAEEPSSRGVTYFLPTRLVTMSVITKAKDEDKAKDKLKKAETAQAEGKKVKDAKAAELKEAEELLARIKKQPASDAQKEAERLADVKVTNAKAADENAGKMLDDLNAAAVLAQAGVDSNKGAGCLYDVSVKSGSLVPDTRRMFRLNPSHSWLRDDQGTFKVTTAGLLSSTNVTATDQTGAILVETAGASSIGKASILETLETGPTNAECAATLPFTMTFDPLDVAAGGTARVDRELIGRNLPYLLFLTPLPLSGQQTPSDNWLPSKKTTIPGVAYRVETPMLLNLYRYSLVTPPKQGEPPQAEVPVPQELNPLATALGGKKLATIDLVEASLISLPQAGPVGFVPMESAAFVKTVSNVEFENGMLKAWEYNRPSEVLEFVRLPVKIAKAVISIPAEIISVKVDYSSKEVALLEKEKLLLEQQLKNQKLVACVAAAGDDAQKAADCLK